MNNQIIGIDLADERYGDCSAISSVCGGCKSIVESRVFSNKDNRPQMTIFKRCPTCGVKFKRHIIRQ